MKTVFGKNESHIYEVLIIKRNIKYKGNILTVFK